MLKTAKKEIMKQIEIACYNLVAKGALDAIFNELKDDLKKVIPGPWDDMAIDRAAPEVLVKIKAALLAEVEKISPDV